MQTKILSNNIKGEEEQQWDSLIKKIELAALIFYLYILVI